MLPDEEDGIQSHARSGEWDCATGVFLQGCGGQVGVSIFQASVHSDTPLLSVVGQQGGQGEFLLKG